MKFVKIGVLLVLFLAILSQLTASAMSFAPPVRLEVTVGKSGSKITSFNLTNVSKTPIQIALKPHTWTVTLEGVSNFSGPVKGFDISPFVKFSPTEFVLLPKQTRIVRLGIKMPSSTPDGEYHLLIDYQEKSLVQFGDKLDKTFVNAKVDTIVYVYKGDIKPAPQFKSLECRYNPKEDSIETDMQLENIGTQHARLIGQVLVYSKSAAADTKPLQVGILLPRKIVVLPGILRHYLGSLRLQDEHFMHLVPGDYHLEVNLLDQRELQPLIKSTCDVTVPATP